MRPVTKKQLGEQIVLRNGETVTVENPKRDHREAHPLLVANLGCYCSYCEDAERNYANLQVEHVQPLSKYPHLELEWSNFLLGCANCNGRANKTNKDVVLSEIYLPHLHNTYLCLEYREAGVIVANRNCLEVSVDKAEKLLDTLGLDKEDVRCEMRREAWAYAKILLDDYQNGQILLDKLITVIKIYGCWSIWFTVFKDYREVRQALVEQFPGTSRECFDGDFNPIPRPSENQEDLF